MFNESWPWKRDLGKTADRLEADRASLGPSLDAHGEQEDPYETEVEAIYRVERDVMCGVFAARRLLGMPQKVAKAARRSKVTVTRFPLKGDQMSPDAADLLGDLEMYDTSSGYDEVISAQDLCNLFVHSEVFRLAWTLENLPWVAYQNLEEEDPRVWEVPQKLAGFLVATDKSKAQHLTFVALPELVHVFRVLAEDEVTVVSMKRDNLGRSHVTAT